MKKLLFLVGMLIFVAYACQDDEYEPLFDGVIDQNIEMVNTVNNSSHLDCPDVKMVPLKGNVLEVPDFTLPPIFCEMTPFPQKFIDISGNITHLGEVTGGYVQFLTCIPDIFGDQEVYVAELIGILQASNGDVVEYEGIFWFDRVNTTDGGTECIITGGTGRWEDAQGCFEFKDFSTTPDGYFYANVEGKITPSGVAKK